MKRKEFNNAVDLYSHSLYGFALRFLQNPEDANDVVQDTFEKLWVHCEKIDHNKCKSWLFTCANNSMLNMVSRKRRVIFSSYDNLPEIYGNYDSSFEYKQIVERVISCLPPVQKSILLLRDLEGYSYKEIAQMLDLSSSQVKVYLFRARNKVKKQLIQLKIAV